jgi:hypothetical protein
MPLSNLLTVTSLERLANGLVGQMVTAEVIEDGALLKVEGIVTALRSDSGTLMLELDTGRLVPLASVKERRSAA